MEYFPYDHDAEQELLKNSARRPIHRDYTMDNDNDNYRDIQIALKGFGSIKDSKSLSVQ